MPRSAIPVFLRLNFPKRRALSHRCFLLLFLASTASVPAAAQTATSGSSFAVLAPKADAARDAGRLDEAVSLYRRALALRPSWAEGWWALGTIEYDQDHYAQAATGFGKLIALQPKNGMAHAMLGLCEFELGREKTALLHLQKGKTLGLTQDPSFWKVVLYHEGILLQRKGSFEAARETLERLCQQGVESDEAANILGMTMLRLDARTPPAQGSADADIITRIGRAECLAGQKKYDEARAAFQSVVNEHPAYPNIHYAYGLFLLEVYDVAGGVAELKQEIANYPGNVLARLRIAAVLYKEDSDAGVPYAEEAVRLNPKLGFAHYLLGLLLLDIDQYEKALPELEIAQKALPREAKLYFALGSAYSRAGRKQEAARARATFERLTKEGAPSVLSGEAAGFRGSAQQEVGAELPAQAPQ